MKTPSAVVFDFDGTIVDSMSALAEIASEVMPRRHAVDRETARRLYFETSGLPFFQQLELLFPGNPANAVAAEEFERAKLEGYFREPLFEDARETVEHLSRRGMRTAVSSNNFQELVDEFLSLKGLAFDQALGFREGFAKGEEHFAHLERTWNLPRQEILFVGDSLKDGERARECSVPFVAKEGTFTREEFQRRFPGARVISSLSELKEMFPWSP